jgi:hypothetical protein
MRLTRKKAIELCIELWEWLAETGGFKEGWPKWNEYGEISCYCWFCEYDKQRMKVNGLLDVDSPEYCLKCPLGGKASECYRVGYRIWESAINPLARKKYAKLFLKQIKTLRSK